MRARFRQQWNHLNSWWRQRTSGQSDADFVEALFQDLLGRPADPESRERALESLRQGDLSRAGLQALLSNSPEHTAYETTRRVYQELLGVEPSPTERWAGVQLLLGNGDPEPLRREIMATARYQLRAIPAPPDEQPYHASVLPREIWLELTTRCNMVPPCIQCGRSAATGDTNWRDMPVETWRGLLPVLREARIVGLHGGGEPLLYPSPFDLLAQLDPRRTAVGFNSNGHLLTQRNCERLIEHQLAWLSISLDAATPEMYLRLRRSDRFDRVLENIRRLNEMKARMGSERPRIDINMTVMGANLPELPRFVELAAELQAAKVMFQQIKPGGRWRLQAPDGYWFDYEQEELVHHLPQHAEMMAQAWKRAAELGVYIEYEIAYPQTAGALGERQTQPSPPSTAAPGPEEMPAGPDGVRCGDPWTKALVSVDGDVTFCCYHNNLVILGNSNASPFEEIWNGPTARVVRRLLLTERVPICCRECIRD